MNLAAYLQMEVKSLAEYTPACEVRQREKAKQSWGPNKNCAKANVAKHQQAVDRYAKAMRGTWATTAQIEDRLGMGRATCTPNLRRWLELGLVERRKAGPSDKWNRRIGYEWRMVNPASDTE